MKNYLFLVIRYPVWFIFSILQWTNRQFSLVKDRYFFDTDQFPWVADIESKFDLIYQELNNILETEKIPNFHEISEEQEYLNQDNKWKTFFMWAYGQKNEDNCAKCPETYKALQKIPGMKTAMFSILHPHKHIPPHQGVYNGVLRYHLGLIIPSDPHTCRIRVGDQIRHWEKGKSLIFDDSWEHEAWNNSEQIRVILFVDFLRPLSSPIKQLNMWIVDWIGKSSFVQNGMENLEKWNRKYNS